MKCDKMSMGLYVVTDRTWLGENDLARQVEDAIRGGATFVQLREKALDNEAFLAEARCIKKVTDRYGIPFVINDNVDIAVACGADGVHVGQSDRAAADARAILGPDKIVGVSVSNVEEALAAENDGADYLGVGAVFTTSTKPDAAEVSHETLEAICGAVRLPVVAIGGIGPGNIRELGGTGVDGVAVISAIFAQPDIYAAAKDLRALSDEMTSNA